MGTGTGMGGLATGQDRKAVVRFGSERSVRFSLSSGNDGMGHGDWEWEREREWEWAGLATGQEKR